MYIHTRLILTKNLILHAPSSHVMSVCRYKSREEQLLAEINKLNSSMRTFKESAEDKRRKLETNVMRLEQVRYQL
jgi:hypothetical protein